MKPHLVASTLISHIGYADSTLRIWFKSGDTFDYEGVPEHVFDEMRDSDSVGKYFHANVKGKYTAKRAKQD